jgi:hypothetical protein
MIKPSSQRTTQLNGHSDDHNCVRTDGYRRHFFSWRSLHIQFYPSSITSSSSHLRLSSVSPNAALSTIESESHQHNISIQFELFGVDYYLPLHSCFKNCSMLTTWNVDNRRTVTVWKVNIKISDDSNSEWTANSRRNQNHSSIKRFSSQSLSELTVRLSDLDGALIWRNAFIYIYLEYKSSYTIVWVYIWSVWQKVEWNAHINGRPMEGRYETAGNWESSPHQACQFVYLRRLLSVCARRTIDDGDRLLSVDLIDQCSHGNVMMGFQWNLQDGDWWQYVLFSNGEEQIRNSFSQDIRSTDSLDAYGHLSAPWKPYKTDPQRSTCQTSDRQISMPGSRWCDQSNGHCKLFKKFNQTGSVNRFSSIGETDFQDTQFID